MKQLNIFGTIDNINPDGSINRCEVCKKPMTKQADICSTKCGKLWILKHLPN